MNGNAAYDILSRTIIANGSPHPNEFWKSHRPLSWTTIYTTRKTFTPPWNRPSSTRTWWLAQVNFLVECMRWIHALSDSRGHECERMTRAANTRSHPFRGITGSGKVWPTFGARDNKFSLSNHGIEQMRMIYDFGIYLSTEYLSYTTPSR